MIKLIRNISPFNNRTDMPAAMLVIKKLLAFILCFAAGTLLGNAVVIGAMIVGGKKFLQGETFTESTMELLGLYAMAGMIAASVLYWKIIEKRNLSEMGVTGRIGGLFVGALIGTVLLFVCVAAIMLTGSISFEGLSQDINTSMLLLMLGGYIIQSTAEEFLCRGLVLCSLKDRVPMPVAIAASTFVNAKKEIVLKQLENKHEIDMLQAKTYCELTTKAVDSAIDAVNAAVENAKQTNDFTQVIELLQMSNDLTNTRCQFLLEYMDRTSQNSELILPESKKPAVYLT